MIEASPEMLLEAEIRAALRAVIDPELGHNIVDLGMIYDVIVVPGGGVNVAMTTTVPGCPATDFLLQAVEACTKALDGVRSVTVELTYDPPWTPDMATPELAARF